MSEYTHRFVEAAVENGETGEMVTIYPALADKYVLSEMRRSNGERIFPGDPDAGIAAGDRVDYMLIMVPKKEVK